MRFNTATTITRPKTHEGAPAFPRLTDEQQLRRSVLSCLLWENEFYEDGKSIAQRIEEYAVKVPLKTLANLAVEARRVHNLRHVPLLLLLTLVKRGSGESFVADTIYEVISRADELAELLALYWKDGRRPIAAQLKKGLSRAFTKFDAYALAKYNRDHAIKLRDVLFMVRPKPLNDAQQELWNRLAAGTLESPDTWEVALSGGANRRETFERLLREQKLGYLALLRNLRNMAEAGVDRALVSDALRARRGGADKVLPFRFIAAARAVPTFEPAIDGALIAGLSEGPTFDGVTVVLVDVSGSMDTKLSSKSDLTRMDAACALASVITGDVRVFSFSNYLVEVPHRLGMAGVEVISKSQPHGGTNLRAAIKGLNDLIPYDRLIVITDEQSGDGSAPDPHPGRKGYMINVASYKNGVGYGRWTHLDGFSESVLRYIRALES
ncbi:hypothetical protein AEAC466_04465 [Asticcacaulis sp. AC466]|uniref:vWA domain-containing protein n=1 Tax=Asticcacaulis sp. AC466 TaxID=1282362 RepID=UPI0003C3B712|nr:TROVE domain-containing protein [Asticcacaulis sp. AC466]ESQ85423.1 hypothetical protein AEAC466_04465 [Asticcacaulis sp. AC466]